MSRQIPIIIPSYEPDERLLILLKQLIMQNDYIIIVNDGSGRQFDDIFAQAEEIIKGNGIVLNHEVNCGKGRALKTAFKYVLENIEEAVGGITADSDGQHSPWAIRCIENAMKQDGNSLVLGVRSFDQSGIPWKSVFGNKLTVGAFKVATGLHISDTQTGLRGIPKSFMKELLYINGERFEFETEMLIASKGKYDIVEIPIETIYDSKEEHKTHFDPVRDSLRIYKILFGKFFKYTFASLSSSLVDLMLFSILCIVLKSGEGVKYVAIATILARLVSGIFNYCLNYKFVFHSKQNVSFSAVKYVTLAIGQMICSAGVTSCGVFIMQGCPEVMIKMIVDSCLFFISYQIQKKLIF